MVTAAAVIVALCDSALDMSYVQMMIPLQLKMERCLQMDTKVPTRNQPRLDQEMGLWKQVQRKLQNKTDKNLSAQPPQLVLAMRKHAV